MSAVNHTQRAHALLSASGAKRWLACTPSAQLEDKFPNKSSVHAEEGTIAHELSEILIFEATGQMTAGAAAKEKKRLLKAAVKLTGREEVADEMPVEVQKYVDIVLEACAAAKQRDKYAVLLLEQRFDFSHIVPGGFGTGDTVIVANGYAEILDLKYGRGVRVEATKNEQLMLYGVGASRKYDLIYDIKGFDLTIIQPRLDHFSSFRIGIDELNDWAENYVKPRAEAAIKGEGEQVPGEHCKFCRAKAVCRALYEQANELAKNDFRDPHTLSKDEIIRAYKMSGVLTDWLSAVESHILNESLKGEKFDGYKVVEGRTTRRWSDEVAAHEHLLKLGLDTEDITKVKLIGIGDAEKLLGKARKHLLDEVAVKPNGAPTLVPESDKREPYGTDQIANDFGEPIE